MSDDIQLQRLGQRLYPFLAPNFLSLKSGAEFGIAHTPTYVGGTTAGATTYTAQSGRYTRLGDVVILTLQVAWSAATGTGNARVSLPHTVAANVSGAQRLSSVTFANGSVEVLITNGTNYIEFSSPITNAGSTMVAVEAAGNIVATVVYLIDP